MEEKDSTHSDALELFKLSSEAESDNREAALDDLRFARLSDQWPEEIRKQRDLEGRPCLTINRLPAYIRKVVNSAREANLTIKTHPVDGQSDSETSEIIDGLMRNIQYTSSANIAYDTALDSAVSTGFGYWRINLDYTHDDTFDLDIKIERIGNQFSVYGDHNSRSADSSDWNYCFVLDSIPKSEFAKKYKDKDAIDWDAEGYGELSSDWMDGENIIIAEFWQRTEEPRTILMLSDGSVVDQAVFDENQETFLMMDVSVVDTRETRSHKVTQHIMSGAEILESNEWVGKYIPIVPVYGDEINEEGKRHFRSLIRDAKDSQRMFNYWRSTTTELIALAPKTPFIGPKGAFNTDAKKWATANTKSHSYIEFDGPQAPQRQQFAGPPAGALQEALNAADDIKSIIGIYDAAMGQRSNETSGLAINARKAEGDVSTYHFIDNLSRAIAHTGRIIIDLIPHVYSGRRVIRTLGGRNGKEPNIVQLGQPTQQPDGSTKIYDLSVGKYDLVVDVGPSSITQRAEVAEQMNELLRVFPSAAPLIGDLVVESLDIPGADEIAQRLKAMLPPQIQQSEQGENPEVQQLQQQMQDMQQQGMQMMDQLQQQLNEAQQRAQQLEQDGANESRKLDIEAFKAETERLEMTQQAMMSPDQIKPLIMQSLQEVFSAADVMQKQRFTDGQR